MLLVITLQLNQIMKKVIMLKGNIDFNGVFEYNNLIRDIVMHCLLIVLGID